MDTKVVLVVDDDTRLRQLIKTYLERNGFIICEAENANEAEDLLKYLKTDAIVMDIMMPQKNGDVFTRELKEKGLLTPILILTARGDASSRIMGLEAGADDYLAKPFEPKELLLRLNNLIKRQTHQIQQVVTFGPYSYQAQTGLLQKEGHTISLTSAEQALLNILVQHLNQDISREQLATQLHLDNVRSIDVQIKRLRQKLEMEAHENFIQTIRGKGYRLIST